MTKKIAVASVVTIVVITLSVFNLINEVYSVASLKYILRSIQIIAVLALISGLVIMFLKKNKLVLIFSTALLLGFLLSSFIGSNINNEQRNDIFKDGERIGQALYNYYKDNSIYPKELEELVPKYINEIPKISTKRGEGEFLYFQIDGGKSYSLGFEQYRFDGKGWTEEG